MGDRTELKHLVRPRYNNARGIYGPNWITPPISFKGVTLRIFPLRANLNVLQKRVDGYLNQSFPVEKAGWFRAFLPYVYLMVVDYGSMSAEATNLGWVSQREMFFNIPLEWYRLGRNGLSLHSWASVAPIIFVDQEISMSIGREVYGWPKSLATLGQKESDWVRHPLSSTPVVSISTGVLDKAYAGKSYEDRVFLEVENEIAESQIRFDEESPLLPWVGIPHLIQNFVAMLGDASRIFRRQFLDPFPPGRAPSPYLQEALRLAVPPYSGDMPNIYLNNVNLKQFRSASNPELACYKALVNYQLRVQRLKRVGLLGDTRVLAGDTSGGYRIRLHRYPSLSLAETFGLQGKKWQIDDKAVWTVRPVMPFWLELDMSYDRARTITSSAGVWSRKGTGPLDFTGSSSRQDQDHRQQMRIRTTDGTVAQQISGPFDFPKTTLRVLPLLATKEKLEQFCDAYFNTPLEGANLQFKPWGTYVYLIVTNYDEMSSETNNVGLWAKKEVGFYLPVKRYSKQHPEKLMGVALVPVFCYADNVVAANTSAEVSGTPISRAKITIPPSTWMEGGGPANTKPQPVMEISTQVLSALEQSQPIEQRLLMDILVGGEVVDYNDDFTQRYVIAHWGQTLKQEVYRMRKNSMGAERDLKASRTLALELLANKQFINHITFKQFRDADEPERACYQSIVETGTEVYRLDTLQEIESIVHVRIHQYPTHPIVSTLGLVWKTRETQGGTIIHNLEAVRPFWLKAGLRTKLGRNLCWRANTSEWVMNEHRDRDRYFVRNEKNERPEVNETPSYLHDPDEMLNGWQRLYQQVDDWKSRQSPGSKYLLDVKTAEEAVEKIEPQMTLHTVLSREWENWDDNPRVFPELQRLNNANSTMGPEAADALILARLNTAPGRLVAEQAQEQRKTPDAVSFTPYRYTSTRLWQKPDFCVRGNSLTEFRVYPNGQERSFYWDPETPQPVWYVGPSPLASPPKPEVSIKLEPTVYV
ncbi:hypothetical protein BO221_50700 [Archangium sp. Cb G35]|uniref:hypothetical protein n=1 Tax=Archangium sp. Cb G35 TaxID=1920190 RepID=UPI0009373DA3|nr:hypothetical protein [Archangium sp. Cb G35]OJT16294.1 hypothetical protein BO221_50700 [Archangium sp. Cb G35]